MTTSYNANKAATFNRLRQQGLSEDAAAAQAGISDAEFGNYAIGSNGQMGPIIAGTGTVTQAPTAAQQAESAAFDAGLSSDPNFERVDFAQTASSQPGQTRTVSYTTTSTETVSGGGTTTVTSGARVPTPESQAIGSAYDAKNAEYNDFIKNNPSDFQRRRQGLPPMTAEEKANYDQQLNTLNREKEQLKNQQIDAEASGAPTITTTPNTTTTQTSTETFTSVSPGPQNNLNTQNDPAIFNQTEIQINSTVPQRTIAQPAPDPVITNDSAGFDSPRITEPEPVITNDSAGFDTVASPGNEAIAGFDFADGGPGDASIAGFDFVPGAVATAVGTRSAQQQNTLQNRVSMPASADWRVRLSLAQSASYLYRASNAGIMAPLARTNGVIFPYTPSIETQYQAKYSSVDLVHSNYKGFFYQGSSIESVAIRGTFTAQDTREAEYLLAVIVFFRSIVKMFYGATDPLAGTPPPLVFLSGLGQYQFNNNPCVVSGFNYSLPTDVDYIRANGFNNYGINLDNRRNQSSGPPASGILGAIASVNRLLNSNLVAGALTQRPASGPVSQNNSNTNYTNSTYVPTKIDINLTLLPIQTRQQISSQFNLQNFANGQLLQQGYW